MGRLLKNPDIAYGALGVTLPIGTNTLSDAPVTGLIRFNSSNNRIEFYYNNAWNQVAKIGSVQLVVDNFSGDGSTATFTMSQAESDATAIAVFVGGVYQQPTTNYTVNGSTTITFLSAPPQYTGTSPTSIVVIHNINSTNVPA
jgi:hypothetical protein